jgi:hypothetical protein
MPTIRPVAIRMAAGGSSEMPTPWTTVSTRSTGGVYFDGDVVLQSGAPAGLVDTGAQG